MPRGSWVSDATYAAAERFVAECLRSDGSLFTPGRPIWTAEGLDEFHERFVVNEKTEGGSFLERLQEQLQGASDQTIQLTAEILYFNYLYEDDTGAAHKAETVERVLGGWRSQLQYRPSWRRRMPRESHASGWRNAALAAAAVLLEFMRQWKALDSEDREERLADPWRFHDFVREVPKRGASVQIEGLLHLVFPEDFETIVSPNVKQKIVETFADELDGTEDGVDRELQTIRVALREIGEGFSFYDPELTAIWSVAQPSGNHAWLVRGANAWGNNLIPRWLEDGFVPIGREEDGNIEPGLTVNQILDVFARNIADKSRESLRSGAVSTSRFVDKIKPADLILTVDPEERVFLSGAWQATSSGCPGYAGHCSPPPRRVAE